MSTLEPITTSTFAELVLRAQAQGEEVVSVLAISGDDVANRVLFQSDLTMLGRFHNRFLNDEAHELAAEVFHERTPIARGGLFAELHVPTASLLIFGAGHIAVPLAEFGAQLGFDVTVLDDRREFANAERFPTGVDVKILDFAAPLRDVRLLPSSFVVLVTRAHEYDFECLREIVAQEIQPRYIGMVGSRRRVRAAFTALLDGGVSQDKLAAIHAPIGLDIGAETPAEIALSILAEITRVRRGGNNHELRSKERVLERFFAQ
ncbi:MAG TPA: XdhC family protein [Longimicrobiales bacterium]|nr:XdhC family protein [Longimicrobiales bacterium]